MHWREVWQGKSLKPRLFRALLFPLSCLYWVGWEGYLLVYRLGLKKAQEPHCPVVCIGNLVAGGSGKSPITVYVASLLSTLGKSVVVSCSGYGAPRSESATQAPPGPLNSREWGDEAAMLRSMMPDVPLIVGRDRVEAARVCHTNFPNAILLLDDGFQHLPLRKHLSIVLDPRQENSFCLPAGPYREPQHNRSRADLVLPNGFRTIFRIDRLESGAAAAVALATGARVNVVCALADPSRFLADLEVLGIHIERSELLPDHDRLEAGNLFASLNPDLAVIVTAKDWVKLQHRLDIGNWKILVAKQEARIEPEAETFRDWMTRKLDELSIESPPR